jgi:hypothetical protein
MLGVIADEVCAFGSLKRQHFHGLFVSIKIGDSHPIKEVENLRSHVYQPTELVVSLFLSNYDLVRN